MSAREHQGAGEGPRGLLLVVSAASGAGKTTLCHRLLDEFPELRFSVSYTTRPRRGAEVDGVDYSFVSDEAFSRMVAAGRFAEWAEVHGNRYGTAWETVQQALAAGRDLLFDIDWQGGVALHDNPQLRDDTVMVFVLPPSMAELERRLRGRGTDADEVVARRLAKAADELRHYEEYTYLVLNDQLERAYDDLRAIYLAARSTRARRGHLARALIDEASGRSSD